MLTPEKLKKIEIWTGNHAIAEAAIRSRPDVISAYPITPSTPIIQDLSDAVGSGKLKAEFIAVESEHSAMGGCIGASAAGGRAFTATASQGLLYMMENVYYAGFSRLPMTMALVNRAFFGGWSIWVDHQDMYSVMDAGWIQLIAKNNQEAHDLIPQAFKVSENHDVYAPAMVNIDGFTLSHVSGQVEPLPQKLVDDFLPPFDPIFKLDPLDPVSFGSLTLPDVYRELREDLVESMLRAKIHLRKTFEEFAELTGRDWGGLVEVYGPEHADVGIVAVGTLAEEAEVAVDFMNNKNGKSFGVTRLRSLRPFPTEEIQEMGKRYDKIVVIDRGYSFGADSPIVTEIRNALYKGGITVPVKSIHLGIGGAEVPYNHIVEEVMKAIRED